MNLIEEILQVSEEEREYRRIILGKQFDLRDKVYDKVSPLLDDKEWEEIEVNFPDPDWAIADEEENPSGDRVLFTVSARKYAECESEDIDVYDALTIFFETESVWINYGPDTVSGSISLRERRETFELSDPEHVVSQILDVIDEWEKERVQTRLRVAKWAEEHPRDDEDEED
jgi:hypothetical protein